MIQAKRLWNRLMELGEKGRTEQGGVTRLAFSEAERSAEVLLRQYMEQAGLTVTIDAVGNLIGLRQGKDPEAPKLLVGSHIDTVFQGGRFDGALGVLAGIEALQSLDEEGLRTVNPVELVVLKDEEGARFSFGMMGSRALAGTLMTEDLERRDAQGKSIRQAMLEYGIDPERIGTAVRRPETVKGYLEVHIEQGKVLETENLPVGIVQGISGLAWLKFILKGEAGHAGATPMNMRQDALAAAAEILTMIEFEARAAKSAVATVGQLEVFPGGINIIPGQVEFTLDVRDLNQNVLNTAIASIIEKAHLIASQRQVTLETRKLEDLQPVPCSESIQNAIRSAFQKRGLTPFNLPSGAGHDGMQFAGRFPIGMIFVRSERGISHSPEEWSSPEDCAMGAEVLFETILELAGRG